MSIFRPTLVLLLVFFVFWFPFRVKRATHSFRPAKCLTQGSSLQSAEASGSLPSILKEPFFYLSEGTQSYVFVSRDQKHVLKFFRNDFCFLMPAEIVRLCRKWFGLHENCRRSAEIEKLFSACELSFSLAKEQTGLEWIHLNPKHGEKVPGVVLVNHLGKRYPINPAEYCFVLQKKMVPLKRLPLTPEIIASYTKLIEDLAQKGLVNLDLKIGSNFGVLEGQVKQIDFGNFVYRPEDAVSEKAKMMESLKVALKM